jgi:predicted nucleic acid-binding protein
MLCGSFQIIGIDHEMLETALAADNFKDIEDGTQIQCAAQAELDYIITRDSKGFENSPVTALLPTEFLQTELH